MCGGHQRTLSNRRLPSSQSKPTAVDRQKEFSINQGKRLQEPPKSNKKEKLKKESVRFLHVVSQASLCLQACACAPVNKTDHQCSVGRPLTSTPAVGSTRPHELRVISVVLDAKLAHAQWPPSRSRVPTNAPISSNVTFAYCTKGCIDVVVLRGRPLTHVSSLSMHNLNPFIALFLSFFFTTTCRKGA